MTEEYLHELADFGRSTRFDAPTKAALRLAEHMTDHPDREVQDDLFAELRQHFDEAQILELGAMIGLFHYTNRFNNAFAIDPTT